MINNQQIGLYFDFLKNKNKYPYRLDYKLYNFNETNPEYEKAHKIWGETDENIKHRFEAVIKLTYNASDNLIQTAYEIMDYSDNGFSYKEIEIYIIILINFYEKEFYEKEWEYFLDLKIKNTTFKDTFSSFKPLIEG